MVTQIKLTDMEKYNNCSPEEGNFKVTREFTDGERWSPLFFKTLGEAEKARHDFLFSFISRGVRSVIFQKSGNHITQVTW